MELTVDNRACDLGAGPYAVPGYDAGALADPEACREGRSLRLTVPATPRNDEVLGRAADPHTASPFNAGRHTAVLSAGGAVLMAGAVRLLEVSGEGFLLEIRDGGSAWAENAALRMFNTLDVTFSAPLTPAAVVAGWTDSSPVKFFPVHRDEYPQRNGSQDLLPAERLLSVDDYHPFLHVSEIVERIFAGAGYRIRSRFLASEFFRGLYMSGAYPSRDTAAAESRMGFSARRLVPATAAADHLGRVYADPKALYNTVGNVVETAAAGSVDADGETVPGLYDNGGCFALREGRIAFTPPAVVSVGFEFYLRYTTDHRILSRTRLRGFDTFYLGPGSRIAFALANRYADRRSEIAPNRVYRAIVFDHVPGASYRLTCTRDGVQGVEWGAFAARSAQVTTPASGSVTAPVLLRRSGDGWVVHTGDWALYDGYVGETGRTTVEVRLRTAAAIVGPDAPHFFNQVFFEGAEEGMTLTLHKECALRPCFGSGPGFGAQLAFADVAQHRIRQIELLEALAHLFNLRFYTEPATRTVWIEPADDFFGAGPAADWSAKTDFSQEVVRSQLAAQHRERRTWGYQPGDGAVRRFEAGAKTELGRWTYVSPSFAARQGEQVRLNPLFSPSLDSVGHYLNAPSARMLQVGDRDDADGDGTNFTPRIVRFDGMHALPDGERWGAPSGAAAYPLAAFHFEGDALTEGFTLCFEDRDGIRGLHRFHDRQAGHEATGERIELSLRIAPDEYEALFAPGTGAADIRSVFRIDTGAGVVRATLAAIAPYDPDAASVRCTFDQLAEDGA